jgi:hypothetical protein
MKTDGPVDGCSVETTGRVDGVQSTGIGLGGRAKETGRPVDWEPRRHMGSGSLYDAG